MHRRVLYPLAAGILGLVAFAPVLVSEPSALAAGSVPAKATTTSASSDPGSDSGSAPGPDSGTDPSNDSGTDPGNDSGSDPGNDSGSDPGSDSSAAPGSNSGPDSGSGSGSDSDSDSDSGPGSGSGSGSGSGQTSSTTCDAPVTDRGPAPQVGDAPQTHEAGEAGSVEVERLSDTELRVVGASPNDGWQEQVKVPSGPRVTVRFDRSGQSPSLIRFAASMDERGTMIHIRVTSCG